MGKLLVTVFAFLPADKACTVTVSRLKYLDLPGACAG